MIQVFRPERGYRMSFFRGLIQNGVGLPCRFYRPPAARLPLLNAGSQPRFQFCRGKPEKAAGADPNVAVAVPQPYLSTCALQVKPKVVQPFVQFVPGFGIAEHSKQMHAKPGGHFRIHTA